MEKLEKLYIDSIKMCDDSNSNATIGMGAAGLFLMFTNLVLVFMLHLRLHVKSKCCGSWMDVDLGKSDSSSEEVEDDLKVELDAKVLTKKL